MTRMHELIRPELLPIDAEFEAAEDTVDRPEDSLDPDEVEGLPAPAVAAAAEVTTARATLDPGDPGSVDVRHPGPPARRCRVALELPRWAATTRRPSACIGDCCRWLAVGAAVIHIAIDSAGMTTMVADTGELPRPGETTPHGPGSRR